MLSSLNVFIGLHGNWSFTRIITNFKDHELSGTVIGTAKITPIAENQLLYEEDGRYTPKSGIVMPINKDYVFVYNPDTGNIEKNFAENKKKTSLFYAFGDYRHKCGDDFYEATYNFPDDPNFSEFMLSYKVSGGKDYAHNTTYTRKHDHPV